MYYCGAGILDMNKQENLQLDITECCSDAVRRDGFWGFKYVISPALKSLFGTNILNKYSGLHTLSRLPQRNLLLLIRGHEYLMKEE